MQPQLFETQQSQYTSDDYWTPKWIFDALKLTFDLDVACPPEGPTHTPCNAYYTQKDDGLQQKWEGLVWMNPPYSKPAPWVDKFIEHNNGIALLPSSNGKWLNKLWEECHAICIMPPNLKFESPKAKGMSIPVRTFLVAMGQTSIKALHQSNIGRVR